MFIRRIVVPVSSLQLPSVLFTSRQFSSTSRHLFKVRQFSSISSLPLFSRHEARLSYNIAEYKKASHMSHDNIFKCHIIVTVRVSICDRPECCWHKRHSGTRNIKRRD
eukprot:scaffold8459_cov71-Skeletonema_dohrnii-CCMP3373.AAC.1